MSWLRPRRSPEGREKLAPANGDRGCARVLRSFSWAGRTSAISRPVSRSCRLAAGTVNGRRELDAGADRDRRRPKFVCEARRTLALARLGGGFKIARTIRDLNLLTENFPQQRCAEVNFQIERIEKFQRLIDGSLRAAPFGAFDGHLASGNP